MGAQFYFDQMLPTVEPEAKDKSNPLRQLEVFTYGNKLFLRAGPVNQENAGLDRYTVELSSKTVKALLEGIDRAAAYLGYDVD